MVTERSTHLHTLNLQLDFIESVFLDLIIDNRHIYIGTIYKPPSANNNRFIDKLHEMISSLNLSGGNECIISGDFNIDLLPSENNITAEHFLNSMSSLTLIPQISKPTRITNVSATLIDNIFTTLPTNVISGTIFSDISDHFPNFLVQKQLLQNPTRPTPDTITYRLITEQTLNALTNALQHYDYSPIYADENLTNAITSLSELLNTTYDIYCPIKKKTVSPKARQKPWITRIILRHIKQRNNLFTLYRQQRIPEQTYKRFRNFVTNEIRHSKRDYFTRKLTEYRNDTKNTWRLINNTLRPNHKTNRNRIKQILTDEGYITDDNKIADTMNEYFVNVGQNIAHSMEIIDKNPLDYIQTNNPQSFFFSPITEHNVQSTILSLKNGRSNLHSMPTKILKHVSHIISPVLTHIINKSFTTGTFPNTLKVARVTPIPKQGDPTNIGNYRPISCLPTISKVFEKLAHKQLYNYLEQHNILFSNQFGFRRQRSTTQAIVSHLQYLYSHLDSNKYCISIFLDFRKAFDTVDHSILLSKMNEYGIRGLAHCWFRSYLNNRKQYTVINNANSSTQNITHGVPQGSILGPLLFLIFINDLPNSSPLFKYTLFADDSTLTTTLPKQYTNTAFQQINSELAKINTWLLSNKISTNIEKTKYMCFSYNSTTHLPPIYLGNNIINETQSIKFLGLHFDKHLTFKQHVAHIASKISKSLGILYKLKHYMPQPALKLLYFSLIHPYYSYGIEAWHGTTNSTTDKLFIMQKRAIRSINNLSYNEHTNAFFKQNNILKLADLYNFQLLVFMFNILHTNDLNIPQITTRQQDLHNHNTRNRDHLTLPQYNRARSQNSISYRGVVVWNALPESIKTITNIHNFKNAIRSELCNNY